MTTPVTHTDQLPTLEEYEAAAAALHEAREGVDYLTSRLERILDGGIVATFPEIGMLASFRETVELDAQELSMMSRRLSGVVPSIDGVVRDGYVAEASR